MSEETRYALADDEPTVTETPAPAQAKMPSQLHALISEGLKQEEQKKEAYEMQRSMQISVFNNRLVEKLACCWDSIAPHIKRDKCETHQGKVSGVIYRVEVPGLQTIEITLSSQNLRLHIIVYVNGGWHQVGTGHQFSGDEQPVALDTLAPLFLDARRVWEEQEKKKRMSEFGSACQNLLRIKTREEISAEALVMQQRFPEEYLQEDLEKVIRAAHTQRYQAEANQARWDAEETRQKELAEQYRAELTASLQARREVIARNKAKLNQLQEEWDTPVRAWELEYALLATDDTDQAAYVDTRTMVSLDERPDMSGFWMVLSGNDAIKRFFHHMVSVTELPAKPLRFRTGCASRHVAAVDAAGTGNNIYVHFPLDMTREAARQRVQELELEVVPPLCGVSG